MINKRFGPRTKGVVQVSEVRKALRDLVTEADKLSETTLSDKRFYAGARRDGVSQADRDIFSVLRAMRRELHRSSLGVISRKIPHRKYPVRMQLLKYREAYEVRIRQLLGPVVSVSRDFCLNEALPRLVIVW